MAFTRTVRLFQPARDEDNLRKRGSAKFVDMKLFFVIDSAPFSREGGTGAAGLRTVPCSSSQSASPPALRARFVLTSAGFATRRVATAARRLAGGLAAMSTTDEEATSFFRRSEKSRVAAAGGSVHRSASKWLPPRPADTDSSSDIEFVGTSSAVKQRTGNDPKGKGRATEQGRPAARKNASGAAPTRRARRSPSRLSSSSFGSSSDDGDGHRPTSGQMLPSATHIADSGATLRALARDKGWQGQSPPPHAKRRTEAAPGPARKRKQKQSDPSSEPSDLSDFEHRRGRDASTSTDQTTISDRSSSFRGKQRKTAAESVSGPTTKLTTAKRTATSNLTRAKPRQKRGSKAASPSPSPEVDLDNLPPPPESFWGVDTSLSKSGAAVKKHRHGEATDRLKSLSEQRSLLVLPDDDDEDEPRDEIALADSGSSSAGEEARYELTTVKSKREKEEALGELPLQTEFADLVTRP